MPWCDDCDRFYNPNTLTESGACPECGSTLERSDRFEKAAAARAERGEGAKIPWHFWFLAVALVIYLGYRLIQLIVIIVT